MHQIDPQNTLLNIDEDYDLTTQYPQLNILEPWKGNYDKIMLPKKQLTLPKNIKIQNKTPLRNITRRKSIETTLPSRQDSCPKIESKTPLQSFQMTSLSPRKNSTNQFKFTCLKNMFKRHLQQNQLTWSEYYKIIQRNHNQQTNTYNLIGYNIQPLKLEDKQVIVNNLRIKIKSQSTKNQTAI